jgi:hypothetical protein
MSWTLVTPAGQNAQLGCVKHVFTDGFTVGVTELVFAAKGNCWILADDLCPCSESTKNVTLCSIAGTSGACGPAGVNVAVDLNGGTGTAPPPSGPNGTTTLTAAELSNKPI